MRSVGTAIPRGRARGEVAVVIDGEMLVDQQARVVGEAHADVGVGDGEGLGLCRRGDRQRPHGEGDEHQELHGAAHSPRRARHGYASLPLAPESVGASPAAGTAAGGGVVLKSTGGASATSAS